MLNISASPVIGVDAGLTKRESAAAMKSAGFDGVDIPMRMEDFDASLTDLTEEKQIAGIKEYAAAARDAGLALAQCHLPYYPGHFPDPGDGSKEAFAELMLPIYHRALDVCAEIGCRTAVMHPYFDIHSKENCVEGNLLILRELLPQMKKSGVRVALENVYASRDRMYIPAISQPETAVEVIEALGSPLVGACLDTGHSNIAGNDICEAARKLGSHLIALHIHANNGSDDHAIPYSITNDSRRLDFHRFSSVLYEIGYTGYYNLEVHGVCFFASAVLPYYQYAAATASFLANEGQPKEEN